MSDTYCIKCGGTGMTLEGKPCSCLSKSAKFQMSQLAIGTNLLPTPEQYQGLVFNKEAMAYVDADFRDRIEQLYLDITHGGLNATTVVISCPANSGKKVFAYSCIEQLFRQQLTTFPIMDVLQLNRVLGDIDNGRSIVYPNVTSPADFYKAPYLFVVVPQASFQVYDALLLIKQRRTLSGLTTIFLMDSPWQVFTALDKACRVTTLLGDGKYSSIKLLEGGFSSEAS